MASSARRIGLSTRSGRKTSREEDSNFSKSRKISGNRISGEEYSIIKRGNGQLNRGIHDHEPCYLIESVQKIEFASIPSSQRYASPEKNTVVREMPYQPGRKISPGYKRPAETFARKHAAHWQDRPQTRLQTFLIQYEPFILSSLALLIVSVSIYIFFIEGQSLFSNDHVV